jgi:hypothetical protein
MNAATGLPRAFLTEFARDRFTALLAVLPMANT